MRTIKYERPHVLEVVKTNGDFEEEWKAWKKRTETVAKTIKELEKEGALIKLLGDKYNDITRVNLAKLAPAEDKTEAKTTAW